MATRSLASPVTSDVVSPVVGSAADGFSPADMASPLAWFDSDDASTLSTTGSDVTQWDNKAGTIGNLAQATASHRYVAGSDSANGADLLTVTEGDHMEVAVSGLPTDCTIYIVFDPTTDAFYMPCSGQTGAFFFVARSGDGGGLSSSSGSPTYRINGSDVTFVNRGDAHTQISNAGGLVLLTCESVNMSIYTGFFTTIYDSDSNLSFDGNLGDVVISGAKTLTERDNVENYLMKKYGIT